MVAGKLSDALSERPNEGPTWRPKRAQWRRWYLSWVRRMSRISVGVDGEQVFQAGKL